MKQIIQIASLCLVLALAATGCAKKEKVDTAKLQSSFKSAEPAQQNHVDKVVSAINAGDYKSAFASLQRLTGQANLTPEQKQVIRDVMEQVQKAMTDAAQKTAADLKKSLPAK